MKLILNRFYPLWHYAIVIFLLLSGCGNGAESTQITSASTATQDVPTQTAMEEATMTLPAPSETPAPEPFELQIEGFARGEIIPAEFACTGANQSPAMSWNAPPDGTESFALLFVDPDAPGGSWVHWILFNIPSESRNLAANLPAAAKHVDNSQTGANSWGEMAYGGLCPPKGTTHEYLFILFALDNQLDMESGATKSDLLSAIEGHILAKSSYTGLFSR